MAIASLIGSFVQAGAARDAGAQAAAASDRAAAGTERMYNTTRSDLLPFAQSGQAATARLNALFGLGGTQQPMATAPQQVAQTFAPSFGNTGNTGNGGIPEGYRFVPPTRASNGESGDYPVPGMLVDATTGQFVAEGNTAQEAMAAAGLSAPQQTQQQAPAPVQYQQPANVGAMPGAGSSVTPYAAPNGGVFAPEGGPAFTGQTEFRMTPEQLAQTPGYQFALAEGNKGIMASSAARGGLLSGASVKAAQRFATGLADSTYRTQADVFGQNYNRAATQFGDNYNRRNNLFTTNLAASTALNDQYYARNISPLFDLAKMGAGAAGLTGQIGADSARAAGQFQVQGGTAQAAGTYAAGQAWSNGIGNASNNLAYMLGRAG